MKSYLIKNKKYSFMIILFISLFLFVDNAHAMIKKDTIGTQPAWSQRSKNGTVTSGNWTSVSFPLSSNLTLNTNYDYIGIQLNNSEYVYSSQLTLNGSLSDAYCDSFGYYDNYDFCPGGNCSATNSYKQITCKHVTTSSGNGLTGNINNQGDVYHYYVLMNATNDNLYPCFFSSEMEEVIFCPTKNNNQAITMTGITFYLSNKASSTLNYYLTLDDIKTYYNENSTEIINALTQLGTIQQNTTTTIQNFNNYVSNTDTSTSTANSNTALGGMNSEFSSHLSKMNELTQLTMLPITFINSLLTNTCQPLVWDIPFVNSRVVVPCMSTIYNGYFSALVSTFSLVMTSLLGYRAFIRLFNAIKGIVDAEDDKLEVVDL